MQGGTLGYFGYTLACRLAHWVALGYPSSSVLWLPMEYMLNCTGWPSCTLLGLRWSVCRVARGCKGSAVLWPGLGHMPWQYYPGDLDGVGLGLHCVTKSVLSLCQSGGMLVCCTSSWQHCLGPSLRGCQLASGQTSSMVLGLGQDQGMGVPLACTHSRVLRAESWDGGSQQAGEEAQ